MSFTWQSAGHAFASLFKDVVTVSKKVLGVLADVEKEAPLIEELTGLVSPQAESIEMIAFGALGALVDAVNSIQPTPPGTTPPVTTPVNVTFEADVVNEVKLLIAQFPQIIAQVKALFP